jgi:hypothetical protein
MRVLIVIADDQDTMELTLDQAREIARLRRRYREARLVVHERDHDVIVEVRDRGRVVRLERFADDGTVGGDERLPLAA